MTEPPNDDDTPTDVVLMNHTDKVRPEVDMLTRALSREQFDITVLLPERARLTLTPYQGIDYRFYDAWFVPNVRYTIPHPSFRSQLEDTLRDTSVFHIMGYVYLPCFVSAAVARRNNVGTVLTVDAFPGVGWSYGNRGVDLIAQTYTHTLGRTTLSLVDNVIGIGEYLRENLERFTTDGVDVAIIPNGVDTDRYRPRPVDSTSDTTDATELLFVGRLDTVKGIPYLLRAMKHLCDSGAYHLTLVGDGSRRGDYETLTEELGIADAVTFEGYQSDVYPYYTNCDIFALPSLSEGLPTVLIEAQACGVPVVSTDVGGARELVRGGHIVPPKNSSALQVAIEDLTRRDRSELGEIARQHVLSNYTLEQMATSYGTLYRNVARLE